MTSLTIRNEEKLTFRATCCGLALAFMFGVACSPGGGGPSQLRDPGVDEGATASVVDDGVRMIPVKTSTATYRVWTRKLGDNPSAKVLLLHGGPGATHEYLEPVADALASAGIEVYLYDQLGSHFSDQPDEEDLWHTARFVDEVEQVRRALGLDEDNFILYGHSWGGILAIEYALAHGAALKGLVISNMMSSIPDYNRYADGVLKPQIEPAVLAEIEALEAAEDYENPRYMELLMEHHYVHHILRRPTDQWPESVNNTFAHLNPEVYVLMQGPSELGASGRLVDWYRSEDLSSITVPTLVIGSRYDTMDPAHMEWMAGELPNGRYLLCPNGSHMAMYDDEAAYMRGLESFIREVAQTGS
jgi:proline iminopeptidase